MCAKNIVISLLQIGCFICANLTVDINISMSGKIWLSVGIQLRSTHTESSLQECEHINHKNRQRSHGFRTELSLLILICFVTEPKFMVFITILNDPTQQSKKVWVKIQGIELKQNMLSIHVCLRKWV